MAAVSMKARRWLLEEGGCPKAMEMSDDRAREALGLAVKEGRLTAAEA
jgi:hypothetical protein